jgi:Ala-tRNA(Pro) deacylase
LPKFGSLYDMNVNLAEQLTEDEEIAFSAGTHTELVRMSYKNFESLVRPKIIALT